MFITVVIVALLIILVCTVIPWSSVRPRWRHAAGDGDVAAAEDAVIDATPPAVADDAPSRNEPSTADQEAIDVRARSELYLVWPQAESDRIERLLVARRLSGELGAAPYRRAMAQLARLDDLVNPVTVPPCGPTGTDPHGG